MEYIGPWTTVEDPQAILGSYARADTPGATVRLQFMGTGLDVYLVTGPDTGRLSLRVDGQQRRAIDLSTPVQTYRRVVTVVDRAPYGLHTVELTLVAGPQGQSIGIDGFVVRGPRPWPRYLTWDDLLFWTGVVLLFTVGRRAREQREAEKVRVDVSPTSSLPFSGESG